MQVQVENSQFARARLFDLPFGAEVTLPDGQVARLTGTISLGQLSPDELVLRGPVHLDRRLLVQRGRWTLVVPPGDGVLTLLPRYAVLRIGWFLSLVPLGS